MKNEIQSSVKKGLTVAVMLALGTVSLQAQAQLLHDDDVNITGNLCAGSSSCTGTAPMDLVISDTAAEMLFQDTTAGTDGDYQILVNANDFRLRHRPEGSNTLTSVFVIEDGGGENALYIDTFGRIGLHHDEPLTDLHISDALPEIRLEDSDNSTFMDIQYSTSALVIEGNSGQNIINIDATAPVAAFDITGAGNIGIGTSGASQPLHVRRNNGTAQIFVEDTDGGDTAKTLFRISSNFNAKFEIDNTDGALWAFTNAGTDFRVSRQGSGVVEFSIDNAGNAVLAGTLTQNSDVNAKQAIVPVDSRQILDKVIALPISQWQYKDTAGENHIGPMAQDFYAAFALGGTSTGISSIDTGGVALAAIQALADENRELKARLDSMEQQQAQELAELRSMLVDLQMAQGAQQVLTANR